MRVGVPLAMIAALCLTGLAPTADVGAEIGEGFRAAAQAPERTFYVAVLSSDVVEGPDASSVAGEIVFAAPRGVSPSLLDLMGPGFNASEAVFKSVKGLVVLQIPACQGQEPGSSAGGMGVVEFVGPDGLGEALQFQLPNLVCPQTQSQSAEVQCGEFMDCPDPECDGCDAEPPCSDCNKNPPCIGCEAEPPCTDCTDLPQPECESDCLEVDVEIPTTLDLTVRTDENWAGYTVKLYDRNEDGSRYLRTTSVATLDGDEAIVSFSTPCTMAGNPDGDEDIIDPQLTIDLLGTTAAGATVKHYHAGADDASELDDEIWVVEFPAPADAAYEHLEDQCGVQEWPGAHFGFMQDGGALEAVRVFHDSIKTMDVADHGLGGQTGDLNIRGPHDNDCMPRGHCDGDYVPPAFYSSSAGPGGVRNYFYAERAWAGVEAHEVGHHVHFQRTGFQVPAGSDNTFENDPDTPGHGNSCAEVQGEFFALKEGFASWVATLLDYNKGGNCQKHNTHEWDVTSLLEAWSDQDRNNNANWGSELGSYLPDAIDLAGFDLHTASTHRGLTIQADKHGWDINEPPVFLGMSQPTPGNWYPRKVPFRGTGVDFDTHFYGGVALAVSAYCPSDPYTGMSVASNGVMTGNVYGPIGFVGKVDVCVRLFDELGEAAPIWQSDYIRLDDARPTASASVAPAGATAWDISWTHADEGSGVASVKLYEREPGSSSWSLLGSFSASTTTYHREYQVGEPIGDYCYATAATDRVGNIESGGKYCEASIGYPMAAAE